MKTYNTSEHVARLAGCPAAACKAFAFDGQTIEFTASERFIKPADKHDDALFTAGERSVNRLKQDDALSSTADSKIRQTMKRYYFELLNEDYDELGVCIPDGRHKQTAVNRAKAWMRENGVHHAKLSVNSMRTDSILDMIDIIL